jgi:RNA polymerase sigma-70 factor (ECF subfamily)
MSTLKTMTDEELALAYIDGNNRAFDELLSRSQDKIFDYIFYMVKDEDLANDLFQETFLKLITKLRDGRYVNSGKFICWAMRISHNVIIDYFRAIKSSKIVDQGEDNDLSNLRGDTIFDSNRESELTNAQVLKDVRRLMDNLPEAQREVVYMRYFQDLSFKEIAEQTNVSINTSLGRMRYALMNMRKLSKQYGVNLAIDL